MTASSDIWELLDNILAISKNNMMEPTRISEIFRTKLDTGVEKNYDAKVYKYVLSYYFNIFR